MTFDKWYEEVSKAISLQADESSKASTWNRDCTDEDIEDD